MLHGRQTIASLLAVDSLDIYHEKRGLALHAEDLAKKNDASADDLKTFKMHNIITELTIDSARGATDAAAIIYAHAVLDAALHKLCKICVFVAPDRWAKEIEHKQIKLTDVRGTEHAELEKRLLSQHLAHLERESLLTKCDILFRVLQPKSIRRILKGYRYCRDRLLAIDDLRHDLVHKLAFHTKTRQAEAKVNYLFATGNFFHNLAIKSLRLPTLREIRNEEP